MTKLGELLTQNGICGQRQLQEALHQQVILGGTLGTNLIELGHVDEQTLARYLSKQFKIPALYGDKIRPDPQAQKFIPVAVVDRLEVIPYRVAGRSLTVLCTHPNKLTPLQNLANKRGVTLEPTVVPELRFFQLLQQYYNISRGVRGITLEAVEPVAAASGESAPQPLGADLMSENDFEQLYRRPGEDDADELPVLTGQILEEPAAPAPERQSSGPPSDLVPSTSQPTTAQPQPVAPLQEKEQPEPPGVSAFLATTTEELPLLSGTDLEEIFDEVILPPQNLSPLSFDEATTRLSQVEGRDQIGRCVLRFARSLFSRAMLFTVHRDWAIGWDALGEEINRAQFRNTTVFLKEESVFQLVVNTRAHFLGSLQKDKTNIRFLRDTGKLVPRSAFVMPVLVQGRVVNIFYGDNGHKQHCSSDIGELLILALKISQSYQALIEARG